MSDDMNNGGRKNEHGDDRRDDTTNVPDRTGNDSTVDFGDEFGLRKLTIEVWCEVILSTQYL